MSQSPRDDCTVVNFVFVDADEIKSLTCISSVINVHLSSSYVSFAKYKQSLYMV